MLAVLNHALHHLTVAKDDAHPQHVFVWQVGMKLDRIFPPSCKGMHKEDRLCRIQREGLRLRFSDETDRWRQVLFPIEHICGPTGTVCVPLQHARTILDHDHIVKTGPTMRRILQGTYSRYCAD